MVISYSEQHTDTAGDRQGKIVCFVSGVICVGLLRDVELRKGLPLPEA